MERSILKSKGQAFSDVVYKYSKKSFWIITPVC
jgi:hypothetical protein